MAEQGQITLSGMPQNGDTIDAGDGQADAIQQIVDEFNKDIPLSKITGSTPWSPYTPTGPTNCTMTGRYVRVGNMVYGWMHLAFTGAPSFASMPTLPVTASANYVQYGSASYNGAPIASGNYLDSGSAYNVGLYGVPHDSDRTRLDIYPASAAIISATNPITWANGDFIHMVFQYEVD